MKKFIAIVLIFVMLFTLTACANPFDKIKFQTEMDKILENQVDEGYIKSYEYDDYDVIVYYYDEDTDKMATMTDNEIANDTDMRFTRTLLDLRTSLNSSGIEQAIREAKKDGSLSILPNKLIYRNTNIDKTIIIDETLKIFK